MAEEQAGEQTDRTPGTGRHAAPEESTTQVTPPDPATESMSSEPPTQVTHAEPATESTSSEPATSVTHAEPATQVTPSEPATEYVATPEAAPTRQIERPQGPPQGRAATPARGGGDGARRVVRRLTGLLATLLRIAGLLLAAVLVAFIVLTLVGVNPDNAVAQLVSEGADVLVMRFRDLFLPADPRLGLVVDYGLAALFWLVVGLVAARIVRAIGRLV